MLQCNLLRRGVTISPWMHTFTLVYLFLCVFFCRVTTQYFATHTHTHTPRSCQVCRVLMLADSSAWDGCRLWYRDMRSLPGVCLQWRRKKEMNTNLHSSRRCIHTQTATWNCIYIQSHTHTHTQEVIHHRELTHSSAPRQTGCDAWDLLWTECLYF